MPVSLTIACFALVFAATFWLVNRRFSRSSAMLERLTERAPRTAPAAAKTARPWTDLLANVGARVAPRKPDRLQRDFVRAGIRAPRAAVLFHGSKLVCALFGLLLVPGIMFMRKAEMATMIMGAVAGAGAGLMLPGEFIRRRIRRRRRHIEKALPNALDLLTICVEAGLGLDQAITQVARELEVAHPEISEEFSMVGLETRAGKRRSDALRSLAERTGVLEIKKMTAVLLQADRFGTSVAQSLRVHSDHLRIQARQVAEEKAAKLGVKLVFPIFFFILPSLFVLTVGPVIVRIFRDLLPMMNSL